MLRFYLSSYLSTYIFLGYFKPCGTPPTSKLGLINGANVRGGALPPRAEHRIKRLVLGWSAISFNILFLI